MNMLPERITTIKSLGTDDLKRELARSLVATSQELAYLAAIWKELEDRGEDLSSLKKGLGVYLPLIASGRLDPECVIRFAGSKMMLQAVSHLPLPVQSRLAAGEEIDVAEVEDGKLIITKQPVDAIKTAMIPKIFDIAEGKIRTVKEQSALLEKRRTRYRAKRLTVSLSVGEAKDIKQAAQEAGLDVEDWARRVLTEKARPL